MKKTKSFLFLCILTVILFTANFTLATEAVVTSDTASPDGAAVQEGTAPDGTQNSEVVTDGTTTEGTETDTTGLAEEPALETHSGNYGDFGGDINFNLAVDGNAMLVGDNITVTGQINGDLFVVADNLTIEKGSAVYGNVFAMVSDKIETNGLVYGMYSVSDTFIGGYDSVTALDMKVVANDITYSGYSERSLYLVANDSLHITVDAYILGQTIYYTDSVPNIETGAAFGNGIQAKPMSSITSLFFGTTGTSATSNSILGEVLSIAMLAIIMVFIALMIILFRPCTFKTNIKMSPLRILATFGIGLVTLVLVPVISVLLLLTLVLAPVAMILLAFYVLGLISSMIIIIFALATKLYNTFAKGKNILFVLLFVVALTVILSLLYLIPFASLIIGAIMGIFAQGMIITYLVGRIRRNYGKNKNTCNCGPDCSCGDNFECNTEKVEEVKEETKTEVKPKEDTENK